MAAKVRGFTSLPGRKRGKPTRWNGFAFFGLEKKVHGLEKKCGLIANRSLDAKKWKPGSVGKAENVQRSSDFHEGGSLRPLIPSSDAPAVPLLRYMDPFHRSRISRSVR
jgi:hypothetical protein